MKKADIDHTKNIGSPLESDQLETMRGLMKATDESQKTDDFKREVSDLCKSFSRQYPASYSDWRKLKAIKQVYRKYGLDLESAKKMFTWDKNINGGIMKKATDNIDWTFPQDTVKPQNQYDENQVCASTETRKKYYEMFKKIVEKYQTIIKELESIYKEMDKSVEFALIEDDFVDMMLNLKKEYVREIEPLTERLESLAEIRQASDIQTEGKIDRIASKVINKASKFAVEFEVDSQMDGIL